MRSLFTRPIGHVLILIVVTAALVFPNLGATSLWDDDEGVNAECTREMMEAGTGIVPTFNWDLRTAKPVLLYWLMRGSFAAFGVTEFAARLPSAGMMFGIVLLTYDLARRMFGGMTGLLAGVIAASTLGLGYLAHAATTDSTLICFTVLYFWAFWRGSVNGGRGWFVPCGIASGLAMLTKGPAVGLILPVATVGSYLLWTRQMGRLLDRRMLWGVLAWVLVAVPWYVLVATETKGEWPRAFFLKENLGRASEPMEGHRGIPVLYEVLVVCVMAAPWSGFLGVSLLAPLSRRGRGVGGEEDSSSSPPPLRGRSAEPQVPAGGGWIEEPPSRLTASTDLPLKGGGGKQPLTPNPSPPAGEGGKLLLSWLIIYFLACAAAATKLPHYIAPAYPALAILTAHFLTRWMNREIVPPQWALPGGMIALALTGLAVGVGMLIAGGVTPIQTPQMRVFPGLANWAWIGLIPLIGAALMGWFLKRDDRPRVVLSLAGSTVLFVGLLSAFPLFEVDRQKAVKVLVEQSGSRQLDREVRVGSLDYTKPSITFYVGRRVERFRDPAAAAEFLAFPIESYLFVPEPVWEQKLKELVTTPYRIAARKYDFDRHCDILVVTNR